jgi:hypothetical protein
VNVSVDISSDVEIDDRSNVRDVQTSSGDVGGDQNRKFFLLERVDDLVTFDLEEKGKIEDNLNIKRRKLTLEQMFQ